MKRCIVHLVAATGITGIASLAGAATTNPSASPVTGQMMSLMVSTLVVVAIIVAAAWLLKRMAPNRYSRGDMLRVVAGAAVGQRERVVVVEIGATWLVLGVAPGHVNVLHQLPRTEQPAEVENAVNKPRTFAQWLTVVTGKNK
jgi:flagellar protein FliO/FliZ